MDAHERYDATGAVQAQVLALLNDYGEGDFTTTIAQRSPLGPRAVRIRPSQVGCEDIARWLASQPSVDAVSTRPPHVYLRVSTDALRAWVAAADYGVNAGGEGNDQLAVVRFAEPEGSRAWTLDEYREAVMGRAVVALLGSRGFDLVIERVLAGETPEPEPETELAATRVVVGGAFPHDADDLLAPVGAVDVRHGALRARHGGSVSAEDLLRDIRERLAGRFTRSADADAGAGWRGAYAEALLTFTLLRTGRARRIQLDEDKLKREAADFDAILEARALPRTGVVDDVGEEAVRELAVELDLLPIVVARAAQSLEPSFLTRFARSLAERTRAARAYMPATDPLWPAVDEAIDLALSLAGIHVPPEVWSAASRAPLGPEQPHPWVDIGPTGGGWAHRASLN